MTDQSYIPKVPLQALVKEDGYSGVGYVDNVEYDTDAKVVTYWVRFNGLSEPWAVVGEGKLRGLTFREFLLYKDPRTGRWKIGLNKAPVLIFGNMVVIACLVVLVAYGAPSAWWWALMIAACVAVPLVTILGTLRNYRKQWKG